MLLSITCFKCDLYLKTYYAGQEKDPDYNPRMHLQSIWLPSGWDLPKEIPQQMANFERKLLPLFKKKRGKPNILLHHCHTFRRLCQNKDFIIIKCNKNFGRAIIECDIYIRHVLTEHLQDTSTYQYLTPFQVFIKAENIKLKIGAWISKYSDDHKPVGRVGRVGRETEVERETETETE
eukprot:4668656-Ditylum_brightwellii.AAC.1